MGKSNFYEIMRICRFYFSDYSIDVYVDNIRVTGKAEDIYNSRIYTNYNYKDVNKIIIDSESNVIEIVIE